MERRFGIDVTREKMIVDVNTGDPVREVVVSNGTIRVIKEKEEVEIPTHSIRGKFILERLQTGIGEYTEPIYV